MLREEDLRIDIGRCEGGSFLCLTHVPSGLSRTAMPMAGRRERELIREFSAEIEAELLAKANSWFPGTEPSPAGNSETLKRPPPV